MIRRLAQSQYEQTLWQEKVEKHQASLVVEYRLCFIAVKVEAQFDPKYPPSQKEIKERLFRVKDDLTLTIEYIRAHRTH